MLSQATIKELQAILEDEFDLVVDEKQSTGIANTMVGYFSLLATIKPNTLEILKPYNNDHRRDRAI